MNLITIRQYKDVQTDLCTCISLVASANLSADDAVRISGRISSDLELLEVAYEKAVKYDNLMNPKKVQVEKTMTFNNVPLPTLYQLRVTCSCGEAFYCDGAQHWKNIPNKNGEFQKYGQLKMEYRFCPYCGQKIRL